MQQLLLDLARRAGHASLLRRQVIRAARLRLHLQEKARRTTTVACATTRCLALAEAPSLTNIGVRGGSIGFKVIDWVPMTTASKVRLRCTG